MGTLKDNKLKIIYKSKWYEVAHKESLLVVQNRQTKKGVYMEGEKANEWAAGIKEESELGFGADYLCKSLFIS